MRNKKYLLFRSFFDLKRSYQSHCGVVNPIECCVIDDEELHGLSLEVLEGAAVIPLRSVLTVFPLQGQLRRVEYAPDLTSCSVLPAYKPTFAKKEGKEK